MPSVQAGSPRSPDATATVRPGQRRRQQANRCGPSSSTVVEPVSTAPHLLTKYLFHAEPTQIGEIRDGCYNIHERIRDMNANGVAASYELRRIRNSA